MSLQGDNFKINVINHLHDTSMDTSTSIVRVFEIYLCLSLKLYSTGMVSTRKSLTGLMASRGLHNAPSSHTETFCMNLMHKVNLGHTGTTLISHLNIVTVSEGHW